MEDLTTIIAEANKDVAELKKSWESDDDVINHYTPFYDRAKSQCNSLTFFITICIQSFKMSDQGMPLLGGAIVDKTKTKEIWLKK